MKRNDCSKENILSAEKERDFARVVRNHPNWQRSEDGKGSHIKEFYQTNSGEQMIPWAAHSGEVSIGVRRSFSRIMLAIGLLVLPFICVGVILFMS